MKEYSPELQTVLKKMCDMVGAPYSVVNSHDYWYQDYEWTEALEEEFRKWFLKYINKVKNARALYGYEGTKKLNDSRVRMFLLQYGWSIKKTKSEIRREEICQSKDVD